MRAPANITIEIGAGIAVPREAADQIRAAVQEWLDAMNLPAAATVEIESVGKPQGPRFVDVAILANGTRCPVTKGQVARCYAGITAGGLDQKTSVNSAGQLLAGTDAHLTTKLLADLTLEAVKNSAEELVTPEVTYAFLARTQKSATARPAAQALDRGVASEVLRRLTSVHVRVPDAAAFVERVFQGQEDGLDAAEVTEELIDAWRPGAIEIHLPVATVGKLLDKVPVAGTAYYVGDIVEPYATRLGEMCDGIFYELGVWLTRVGVVADPDLPRDACRFCLHERLTPVLRGIGEDEILVNASLSQLRKAGITNGREWANPANGGENTVVPLADQDRVPAEHNRWDQFAYIILLFATELRSAAWWLLSLDDVESLLEKVNEAFPALVNIALNQYKPVEIARVLRWLLRRGVSVRDLRKVLELMLDFSYTTGIRSPTAGWCGREPYVYVGDAEFTGEPYFTSDDPYIAEFDTEGMQLCAEPTAEWLASGRILAEFVKCGFREYLTHKITRGQNNLVCCLLDEEIEKRLLSVRANGGGTSPFSQQETSEMLYGMGQESSDYWGSQTLFLATTPDVALLVEDIIEKDFPEVVVLHRQVVTEPANVQAIARVPGRKARSAK